MTPVGQQFRTDSKFRHAWRSIGSLSYRPRRPHLCQGTLIQQLVRNRLGTLVHQSVPKRFVVLQALALTQVCRQEKLAVDGRDIPDRAVLQPQLLDAVIEHQGCAGRRFPGLVVLKVLVLHGSRQAIGRPQVTGCAFKRRPQEFHARVEVPFQVGQARA